MKNKLIIILVTILPFSVVVQAQSEKKTNPITVVYDKQSTQQTFGVTRLIQSLKAIGYAPVLVDRPEANGKEGNDAQ